MGIFELAAELGKTLKNDKRLIALEEARKAYESDERVMKLMMEYEVQQKAIENEVAKGDERDNTLLKMIQERIDAIYDSIIETDSYKALEKAQNDVNELMETVNNTIMFNATGKTPCTHDCSTCGGCH